MVRKFRLEIELGNESMDSVGEIAEALRDVANKVDSIQSYNQAFGAIQDGNGNTVGGWDFSVIDSKGNVVA